MARFRVGFTLIEVLVVAPIVILTIGAFIALVVTLTGNSLVSRESSILQYNAQDALSRIDQDVRTSISFLAVNDITLAAGNPQGYLANPDTASSTGSTVSFTNINKVSSGGSPKSLILKHLIHDKDPSSNATSAANILYQANTPNPCSGDYKKNTPMYANIVYFIADESLWRRTIMPTNYATPATFCGGTSTYQVPTCSPATTHAFCKTQDTKVLENIQPEDFKITYYPSAGSTTANTEAANQAASDAARGAALTLNSSVQISITTSKDISGKNVSKTAEMRSTKLNSPSGLVRPAAPASINLNVVDGSDIDVSWPSANRATVYDVDFNSNGGPWVSSAVGVTALTHKITKAANNDNVNVRVLARNSSGSSPYTTKSTHIPLWVPLQLEGTWSKYDNTFTSPAYSITSAGLVVIKGLVKATSASSGSIIGRMPSKYWPTHRFLLGTTTSPNASARVDVTPDGQVIFSDNGNIGYFSLDTIRYTAASAPYTRTSPTLWNSFTNYGAPYAPASYLQDDTGRVVMQGLLNNGARGNGNAIISLPESLRTSVGQYLHMPSRSGAFHHLGVDDTHGILAKGDGIGAYSINLNYLPRTYTNWTNLPLTASWVHYGAGFSTPQYTKTSDGVVHLKGLVRSGGLGVAMANLPPGYRPAERILYTVPSNGAYSRFDIWSNGDIISHSTSSNWVALDGISFIAEQ